LEPETAIVWSNRAVGQAAWAEEEAAAGQRNTAVEHARLAVHYAQTALHYAPRDPLRQRILVHAQQVLSSLGG